MNMRRECVACCLSVAFVALTSVVDRAADEPAAQWRPLFNGKDLTGWKAKIKGYELGNNYANTFRVEDGVIKVLYDKYDGSYNDRVGYLFYEKPISNYELRVEYRFVGEQLKGGPNWAWRNSGIMIHSQAPESILKDQNFLASIEVQLLGGDGKKPRTTANVCTPCTDVVKKGKLLTTHCFNSKSKTYHGDQWVTVEVVVHGNKLIQHKIDGHIVLQYTKPQLDENDPIAQRLMKAGAAKMLSGGYIALQSESHPVEFRKVEIHELTE